MRIHLCHLFLFCALPLGCNSGGNAFQPDVFQISRGAIPWALTTVLDPGGSFLNTRTEPVSPFLNPGFAASNTIPTQTAIPLQIKDHDEFGLYTLTINKLVGTTNLGTVLAANTSYGAGFTAGTEYWALTQAGLDDIPNAVSITVVGTVGDWDSPPSWPPGGSLPVYTNDGDVPWSSGAPGGSATVFRYSGSNYVAWVWGLTYSDGWSGSLTWYRTASSAPANDDHVFDAATYTLSKQTGGGSAPGGQNWYYSDCAPE